MLATRRGLLQDPGLAKRLVGALAKLRLLLAGLRSARLARPVDLEPDALGGDLGDADRGDLGIVERPARPAEVGRWRHPDRCRGRRLAVPGRAVEDDGRHDALV